MHVSEMIDGMGYVVTKASDDGTFRVGDHIKLSHEQSIFCVEAVGWIAAEEVEEATKGVEIELDKDWLLKQQQKLLNELEKINAAIDR